jgi:pilus assembly protein Flp/PilA
MTRCAATQEEPMASKSRKSTLAAHLARLRARLAGNQDGATAIEYALVASGIGAAVAATVWSLGTTTAAFYQSLAGLLP